jgi:transposase
LKSIAGAARQIVGGVDTHLDLHHVAVVGLLGEILDTRSFATTRAGYRAMLAWMRSYGELLRVGVEQSGSFGAGLTRHFALAGIPVLEVTGPDPALRRAKGKDDTLDAIAAAKAALSRQRVSVAKDRSGQVEALRVLRVTRTTAVKCRRATLQTLRNTILAAPDEVRDQLRNLTPKRLLRTCAAWRPDRQAFRDPSTATKIACKFARDPAAGARRRDRRAQTRSSSRSSTSWPQVCWRWKASAPTTPTNCSSPPATIPTAHLRGGFAMLCGTSPIPASSGKTQRHRLNHGGNRQANSALHMIVVRRMRTDQRTRDYVTRRLAQGKSKREIMRCSSDTSPARSSAS